MSASRSLRAPQRNVMAAIAVGIGAAVAGGLARPATPDPPPMTPIGTGTELVMVFIATSTCPGIDDPSLGAALVMAREGLRREAAAKAQRFTTIGVSLDWSIDSGMEMLAKFGPFDEVSVGRGWLNTGAVKYIWKDMPGIAAVPQIVVLERQIDKGRSIEVTGERVRYRKTSAARIVSWSAGAFGSHAIDVGDSGIVPAGG